MVSDVWLGRVTTRFFLDSFSSDLVQLSMPSLSEHFLLLPFLSASAAASQMITARAKMSRSLTNFMLLARRNPRWNCEILGEQQPLINKIFSLHVSLYYFPCNDATKLPKRSSRWPNWVVYFYFQNVGTFWGTCHPCTPSSWISKLSFRLIIWPKRCSCIVPTAIISLTGLLFNATIYSHNGWSCLKWPPKCIHFIIF